MLAATAASAVRARSRRPARHPSSTSSTARASRCTARGDDVRIFTRNLADITHRRARGRRGGAARCRCATSSSTARRSSLDEDGAPRPFQETMSRFGAEAARETRAASVVLRRAARRRPRPASTSRCRVRLAELERIAPAHRIPGEVTADPEAAERVSRDALAAGPRGRRRQGDRLAVRGRPPRLELDQGQARAHLRPRRARRASGARAGAPGCSRTCTSAPSTRRASSASRAGS